MADFDHGDDVTVTTGAINDGKPFRAEVLHSDPKTETVTVAPELDIIELAVVGESEVERVK